MASDIGKYQQAYEHRSDASRILRFWDWLKLYNIVEYNELIKQVQPINMGTRHVTDIKVDQENLTEATYGNLKIKSGPEWNRERVNEKQTITASEIPTAGTYTLTFDKKTTDPIPHNANAAAINAALAAKGLGDLVATGSMLVGIGIEFTGKYGFSYQAPVGLNTKLLTTGWVPIVAPKLTNNRGQRNQIITPSVIPQSGAYTISFDGHTTAAIPHNANTVAINAALAAAGLGDVKVNGDMLTGITIEFTSWFAGKHQPLVSLDTSWLNVWGTAIPAPALTESMVKQEQIITPVEIPQSGTYTISFDNKTTWAIPYDADDAIINTALWAANLRDIKATGDMLTNITLEFTGNYAKEYQPLASVNASLLKKNKGISTPTVTENVVPQQQKILPYIIPNEWTYTISFGGQTTEPLSFDADEAAINVALWDKGLANLKATGAMNTTTGITIEFDGILADENQALVTVDAAALKIGWVVVKAPKTVDNAGKRNQMIAPTTIPESGTYTISFNGRTTAPILHDADVVDINAALAVAGLGDVKAIGDISTGITIEFRWQLAGKRQPLVSIDTAWLKMEGKVTKAPTIAEKITGQKQKLTPSTIPNEWTYTIHFDGKTTAAIPYNANAAAINAALGAADLGDVKAIGDMVTNITFEFTGGYAGSHQPLVHVDTSWLKAGSTVIAAPKLTENIVPQKQKITPSILPDSGTYTITFDGKTTEPIPHNADSATINLCLLKAGLGNVKAAGSMLTEITIGFDSIYGEEDQPLVDVDTALLTIGAKPIKEPVVKNVPVARNQYLIAQQRWGEEYCVLLKKNLVTNAWEPEHTMPFFFTKDYQQIPWGIAYKLSQLDDTVRRDRLRQK